MGVGEDQLLQMINSVTADDLSHSLIIAKIKGNGWNNGHFVNWHTFYYT